MVFGYYIQDKNAVFFFDFEGGGGSGGECGGELEGGFGGFDESYFWEVPFGALNHASQGLVFEGSIYRIQDKAIFS